MVSHDLGKWPCACVDWNFRTFAQPGSHTCGKCAVRRAQERFSAQGRVCEDSTLCDVRFQGQGSRRFQHLLMSAKDPTRKFDELPFSHSRRPTILSNTPDLLATAAVSANAADLPAKASIDPHCRVHRHCRLGVRPQAQREVCKGRPDPSRRWEGLSTVVSD
jgi:hypothetical protein